MSRHTHRDDHLETRVVLVGKTGAGKSSTGNTILGREAFTSQLYANSSVKTCKWGDVERGENRIKVVDVPGFIDTGMDRNEERDAILQCVKIASPGIHAILMVIRFGRFTDDDQETLNRFISCFGEDAKKIVIVVFTGLDILEADGGSLEAYIANAHPNLKTFLSSINNRYIAVNNKNVFENNSDFVDQLLFMIKKMILESRNNCYTTESLENVTTIQNRKLEEMESKERKTEGLKTFVLTVTCVGIGLVCGAFFKR